MPINYDDADNDCDCGINPVAETYIKSWYGEEAGTCQALETATTTTAVTT